MSSAEISQHAQMSCPAGGKFYACNSSGASRFIGCCGVDPCGSNGCSMGELKPTSFNISYVPPDQQCEAGQFYTCQDAEPAFWGCCKTNPCAVNGCPPKDLVGAFLSSNPAKVSPYIQETVPSNGANDTFNSTSSQSESDIHHHHGVPVGIIVGATLGTFILALLFSVGIFWFYRRRAKSKSLGSSHNPSLGTEAILVPMYSADSKLGLGPESQCMLSLLPITL
jgi:hypothetical protein